MCEYALPSASEISSSDKVNYPSYCCYCCPPLPKWDEMSTKGNDFFAPDMGNLQYASYTVITLTVISQTPIIMIISITNATE